MARPTLFATLSAASRAHACPGSTALARVGTIADASDEGSAQHEALAVLTTDGREAMEAALPSIWARWGVEEREAGILAAKLRAFRPQIPEGALAEVALCLVRPCLVCGGKGAAPLVPGAPVLCEACGGAVREGLRVGEVEGARGQYDAPQGAVVAGSIDVMWSEPEPLLRSWCEDCHGTACSGCGGRTICLEGSTLWIVDYKTGDDVHVPRAERNRQIRWGAALAARWTGAERVVAAICYVEGEQGRWDYRRHPPAWDGAPAIPRPYDRDELAAIEAEIVAAGAKWREQAERAARGEPLDLVTGSHCGFCPARAYCPAIVQPVRALVASDPTRLARGPLTTEEAAQLAEWLPVAERALADVKAALLTHVAAAGPIPLPDGRVWGPQLQPWAALSFEVRATYQALVDEIGEEAADKAFNTSKDAIEKAIAAANAKAGIKREGRATMGRLLARLREEGAITESPVRWTRAHHPPDAPKLPRGSES